MRSNSAARWGANIHMKLRPYQTKIIAEVLVKWQSGKRRVMATAPTGSGKMEIITVKA